MLPHSQHSKMAVIALDLDGTVLRDDKTVSAFTVETLQTLSRKGIPIFFATGRDQRIARQVMPFVDFPAWIILNNGMKARKLPEWNEIYTHFVPASLRKVVFNSLAEIKRFPLFVIEPAGSVKDRVMDARLLDDPAYRDFAERHSEYTAVETDSENSALLERALAMFL